MSTFVLGIGPPLEQIQMDHVDLPSGQASVDILALIQAVYYQRRFLYRAATLLQLSSSYDDEKSALAGEIERYLDVDILA